MKRRQLPAMLKAMVNAGAQAANDAPPKLRRLFA